MKAKILVLVLFGLSLVFLVTVNDRIWSSQMMYHSFFPKNVQLQRINNVTIDEVRAQTMEVKRKTVIFENMRRKALFDPRALYLSRQTTPPFDPAFKNPCWWYGKDNKTLACLPYFYLAGFPKSGTTDLYARLVKHPLISRGRTKEPHYLTRSHFKRNAPYCGQGGVTTSPTNAHTSCDILGYACTFFNYALKSIQEVKIDNGQNSKDSFKYPAITVDASASTAWDNSNGHHIIRDIPLPEQVLESNASIVDWIVRMNPNVRIVVILREPVSRVYSDYNYFKASTSAKSFETFVDAALQIYKKCTRSGLSVLSCARTLQGDAKVRIHIGLYHLYIEEWLARIPRDRIYVVRTEDYHKNMTQSLHRIFDFLELPQLDKTDMDEVLNTEEKNVNHRKVEPILPTTRRKLIKFYKPFNENLAKLLHNDAFLWQDVYTEIQKV